MTVTKRPENPIIAPAILSDIPRSLIMVFKIQTKIELGYTKSLFVNSVVNKIKTRAKNPDNTEDVLTLIAYIETMNAWSIENGSKDLIGSRSPIWKLRDELRGA